MELLLIIDMQEGFRYAEAESILPTIVNLQQTFKGEIIVSKFIDEKNSRFESQLQWTKFQDADNQQIFKELQHKNAIEIEHHNYTVLTPTLIKFIDQNKINKVYLCGIYTDVCILKTAMDLFDNDIEAYVIEDACASLHGSENHRSAKDSLRHILGEDHVISSKEV